MGKKWDPGYIYSGETPQIRVPLNKDNASGIKYFICRLLNCS